MKWRNPSYYNPGIAEKWGGCPMGYGEDPWTGCCISCGEHCNRCYGPDTGRNCYEGYCETGYMWVFDKVEPGHCKYCGSIKVGHCEACKITGYPVPHTELHNVTFQLGSIGMNVDWQTGVVHTIDAGGQAARHGVKIHWVIQQVNGKAYTEDLLLDALAGVKPYVLQFEEHTQCPPGYGQVQGCPDCQEHHGKICTIEGPSYTIEECPPGYGGCQVQGAWPLRGVKDATECASHCTASAACTAFHYYGADDVGHGDCYLHRWGRVKGPLHDGRSRYAGTCSSAENAYMV